MLKKFIFLVLQIFSRALKIFLKSFQPWYYSAKNRLFKARKDWALPTYILYTALAKIKMYITLLKTSLMT